MFNTSAMDKILAQTFCDQVATWVSESGTSTVYVTFDKAPSYSSDGAYQIGTEEITAQCQTETIAGMKRGEKLTIQSIEYDILSVESDGTGWTNILLEKIR